MGGRGTFAVGNNVKYQYKTVDKIENIKVLQGIGNIHDLPVEAHTSSAYIKLYPNGNFNTMRIYNKDHFLVREIAYHPERKLDRSGKPILHIHEYNPGVLNDRPCRLLNEKEYNYYKKYFKGELRWKAEE